MKGDPKVIAILRQAVGAETQSEAQWCQHAAWLARIGLHGLSDYILTEAAEEHCHRQRYFERLVQLDAEFAVSAEPTGLHQTTGGSRIMALTGKPVAPKQIESRRDEIMTRIGTRPALIRSANVADYFGDAAPYRVEDGIAIVDVLGPLSNAAWSWGGTTYGEIQTQLKIASEDPGVKAVLLNVNSPGGETDNAFETAAMVSALDKPCWAVAGTMAYSAAYLIASQANRIYCTETSGGVGSIGVYCAHFDMSKMLEQHGVKVTLISAGEGKTDGNPYEPLSPEAREKIQGEIDRLYGEFVGAVARGRSITPEAVVKLGARTYDGATAAVAAGLADMPGDLTDAWADLSNELQRAVQMPMHGSARSSSAAPAASSHKEGSSMADNQAAPAGAAVPTADQVLQAEQARVDEILDLGALFDNPALAREFVSNRKSAREFRSALIDARAAAQSKNPVNPSAMPGTDAAAPADQPKARPWKEVLASMGILKKEAR